MTISRHNYEEFFILYWDNELPAEQKQQVELFVRKHPDLEEEFRLFGELRFVPEQNQVFQNKQELLSLPDAGINHTNYTSYLISYFDGELTEEQSQAFEHYISEHPFVRNDLELLEKTRMIPDPEIRFPDKATLYRTEENIRRITFKWYHAAAAVMLLLAGLLVIRFLTIRPETPDPGSMASTDPAVIATPPAAIPDQKITDINEVVINRTNPGQDPVSAEPANPGKQKTQPDIRNLNRLPENRATLNTLALNSNTSEDEQQVTIEKITNRTLTLAEPVTVSADFDEMDVTERNSPAFNRQYSNSDILFAGNKETDDESGGLKGLLRKATRVFERRTKIQTTTEDNKLLIGAFAVSLK